MDLNTCSSLTAEDHLIGSKGPEQLLLNASWGKVGLIWFKPSLEKIYFRNLELMNPTCSVRNTEWVLKCVCVCVCVCRIQSVISRNKFYKQEFQIRTHTVDKIFEEDFTLNPNITFLLLSLFSLSSPPLRPPPPPLLSRWMTWEHLFTVSTEGPHVNTHRCSSVCVNMLLCMW